VFGQAAEKFVTHQLLDFLAAGDHDRLMPWRAVGDCPDSLLPEVIRTVLTLVPTESQDISGALRLAVAGLFDRLTRSPGTEPYRPGAS
jgi:hypothetical protein